MGNKLKLTNFSLSDIGLSRNQNQDYYYSDILYSNNGELISGLSVIADGMGGLKNGREVSRIAVKTFVEYIKSKKFNFKNLDEFIFKEMIKGFKIANQKVFDISKKNEIRSGTTLTAALIINAQMYVTHVGDTRVYVFEDKKIFKSYSFDQITSDDNPPNDPHSLTKYIGKDLELSPSTYKHKIKSNSLVLLTTDGFHDEVPQKTFLKLVNKTKPELIPKKLIEEANKVSGRDNVTIVLTAIN